MLYDKLITMQQTQSYYIDELSKTQASTLVMAGEFDATSGSIRIN
jgi:hypothetical protein